MKFKAKKEEIAAFSTGDDYKHIINVRKLAIYLADEKWGKETSHISPKELYNVQKEECHGMQEILILKEKYNDMYWELVDDFEEIILQFEKIENNGTKTA